MWRVCNERRRCGGCGGCVMRGGGEEGVEGV